MRTVGQLRRRIFRLSIDEASFARRGFRMGDAAARRRLEMIGVTFLRGYHAALEQDDPVVLACRLDAINPEVRGFAFEGAAMAYTLLDSLTPWKCEHLHAFLDGPGAAHVYMAQVGAGWALARLHRPIPPTLVQRQPLLHWLAIDGYGFHEGYFHWRSYVAKQAIPRQLSGYARQVFDQGLGRSLWFVEGADVSRIASTIATFPIGRRADLWSGIGLACAYAGGVDRPTVEALRTVVGPYRPYVAQGVSFGAKARERAGNPADHTELACQVLCDLPAAAAAMVTDRALEGLLAHRTEPLYALWRRRIQNHFERAMVFA